MTHELLHVDIELAIRLRAEQCPDDQIIRALVSRGVDSAQAAQLLDDLRDGRRVVGRSPVPLERFFGRRSRRSRRSPESSSKPPPTPAPAAAAQPGKPSASHHHRSGKNVRRVRRIVLLLAAWVLVVVAFILYKQNESRAFLAHEPAAPAPQAGGIASAAPVDPARRNNSPAPLLLELRPDGLRIADRLVARDNLLPALREALGAPTRTNQVARTGVVIYAYDHHGLLVYTPAGGGTNSIVLDCEATGGVNGTTSPFAGSLKLQDRLIRPDTDPQALAAIKEFDLKNPGASDTVWNGSYHGLDLVFAYLRSPGHLSLIEIDLK